MSGLWDDDDDLAFLFEDDDPKPPEKPLASQVTAQTPPPLGLNVGSTYSHPTDFDRLSNSRQRVLLLTLDGKKYSNVQINRSPAEGGGGQEGTRRLRELQGEGWGPLRYTKERGDGGIWWYQLDRSSLTQRILDKVFQNRPDPIVSDLAVRRTKIKKLVDQADSDTLGKIEAVLNLDTVAAAFSGIPVEAVQDELDAIDGLFDEDGG